MSRTYKRGKFTPKNPKKYIGDVTNIIYRSGWEMDFMLECDGNPSIVQWSSEEIAIPYISPVDKRMHRYYPDFMLKVKRRDGTTELVLVEIKPHRETKRPKPPKKTSKPQKRVIKEHATWLVNQAKWRAAHEWCASRKITFKVMTENELYGAKKPK